MPGGNGAMTGGAGSETFYVAVASALAGCLLLFLFARGSGRSLGWALRSLAIWGGAGILVAAFIAQRGDFARWSPSEIPLSSSHTLVVSAPPPPAALPQPDIQSIRFPADKDGHFRVDAMVNGVPIRFLVDTGASIVVLNPADARHIGLDLDSLAFTASAETANGKVDAAPVVIQEILIGPIRLTDVVGAVDRQDTMTSLLGMSFLSRLQGYEVSSGELTLHR
jgi:clan AA aspartic protease (TIGR02281 family)